MLLNSAYKINNIEKVEMTHFRGYQAWLHDES